MGRRCPPLRVAEAQQVFSLTTGPRSRPATGSARSPAVGFEHHVDIPPLAAGPPAGRRHRDPLPLPLPRHFCAPWGRCGACLKPRKGHLVVGVEGSLSMPPFIPY